MGDMNGQVAVVTGGTRGIGLAIGERLLNRGVTVAAGYATNHDHAREFADKYADRGVSVHQGNVGHNEDVLRVFGEVLDRHGHVNILVNNAGITIDKRVRRMDPREWDHVIHVNLSGAFHASRAVLQHMLDRGYGRIINISLIIGSAGGFGQANYAAAKSGMFGLTMSLALETAGKGITVNTVTPGFITTDMTMAVPADALAKVVARIPGQGEADGPGTWPPRSAGGTAGRWRPASRTPWRCPEPGRTAGCRSAARWPAGDQQGQARGRQQGRADPLHHPRGDQQARPDGQTPGNACRDDATKPIRYSLALPQASARRPPSSKNPPKATA